MRSIRLKLWAGMMVLVLIVLLFLWLFQVVFLQSFYASLKVSEVKKEARTIVTLYEQNKQDEFEKRANNLAFNNNASLEVLRADGVSGFISGAAGNNGQMPMMRMYDRTQAAKEVLTGKDVSILLTHPRFGNKFMLIGIPIKSAGKVTGALIINMPMAPVEDTAVILKKQLVWITVLLLLAALAVSYIIARGFVKPILDIKRVAGKMAAGDFSDRIMTENNDEIGDLAATINHMGQELSKTEELRKELIANVSHELRTPLSLIRGYAETIRDVSGNNPEKRDQHLATIIDESERLGRIVDDILNLSQLQAGYAQLQLKSFAIGDAVTGVVRRFDILAQKLGVKVAVESAKELMVVADEQRIEQVLYNLINNAFNHAGDHGLVTIRVLEGEGTARVEVADTGEGIAQEALTQVWNRFYKGDNQSRKTAGTGLGLAIVKSILEVHKAQYGVESKLGEGTTFWFELPN